MTPDHAEIRAQADRWHVKSGTITTTPEEWAARPCDEGCPGCALDELLGEVERLTTNRDRWEQEVGVWKASTEEWHGRCDVAEESVRQLREALERFFAEYDDVRLGEYAPLDDTEAFMREVLAAVKP